MTNESPGYRPEWISHHGEILPAAAQSTLAGILASAGLDPDRFEFEAARARAEFNLRGDP